MSSPIYIILDIGTRYIRVGKAGDDLPFLTIPNKGYKPTVKRPSFLQLDDFSLDANQRHDIIDGSYDNIKRLMHKYQQDLVNWMNTVDQFSLHRVLREMVEMVPLSVGSCRYVVIDNKMSQLDRSIVYEILLAKLGVRSVQFVPSSILAVISSNSANGLVVQFNWNCMKISFVVDYRVIFEYETPEGLTGETLHYKIVENLVDTNACFDTVSEFITNHVSVVDLSDVVVDGIEFSSYVKSGLVNEILLEVADIILTQFEKLGIDIRPLLCNRIVFEGGLSNIPGLKQTLVKLIQQRCNLPLTFNAIKSLGAWQGGSIYYSTSVVNRSRNTRKTEEVTKENLKAISDKNGIQLTRLPEI